MMPNSWNQAWHDFREGLTFMLLEWALRIAPQPLATRLALAVGPLAADVQGGAR